MTPGEAKGISSSDGASLSPSRSPASASASIATLTDTVLTGYSLPGNAVPGSMAHLKLALSRSITMAGLNVFDPYYPATQLTDDIQMIARIRPLYIGRWAGWWGSTWDDATESRHFAEAADAARRIHAMDPDIVVEGAVFEYINLAVNNITVPAWVFQAFDLPVEQRHFSFLAMTFPDFPAHHNWSGPTDAIPDLTRIESKMWYYYRARNYIDAGAESLHTGQIQLMSEGDPSMLHVWGLFKKIRAYGAQHARRNFVWINSHAQGYVTPPDSYRRLVFDFQEVPIRPKQRGSRIEQFTVEKNYLDTIYHSVTPGVTPRDEYVASLPYLAEFDNFGISQRPGVANQDWFPFGYDEITWFSLLPKARRDSALRYISDRIASFGNEGYLQMPGQRGTTLPNVAWPGVMYRANRSAFDQEDAIQAIWSRPGARVTRGVSSLREVCPIGTYDGSNCYVESPPPGANPFLYQNRFYYQPLLKRCSLGTFDGANCHVSAPPTGASPFIYQNRFYYRPINRQCPTGNFDGANCYVGSPPGAQQAFIHQNQYYYVPVQAPLNSCGNGNPQCCPKGSFDGANCMMPSAAQPPSGKSPFIYGNSFYIRPTLPQ
ncbi:MAG: hypothetical protein H7222_08010 [Methylotenera sp.]|nr:hypothetical protein [Oligoflexia bacterium]